MEKLDRHQFVSRAIRYLLLGLLGIIVFITGSKAVSGSDCSSCPGKGICDGESDCSKFLKR